MAEVEQRWVLLLRLKDMLKGKALQKEFYGKGELLLVAMQFYERALRTHSQRDKENEACLSYCIYLANQEN